MAKNVFRSTEVVNLTSAVKVEAPQQEIEEPEVIDEIPEYTGPTADDLRREAEVFRESWETEKAEMIAAARTEAERIVKDGETKAFEEVKKQTDEARQVKQTAETEAAALAAQAEEKAATLITDA